MRERIEIVNPADERAAQHCAGMRFRTLQRVQRRIWQMRNPDDIAAVLEGIDCE